jgi:ubiquinone/menaquinone biosynthesis C-methylase UbiE
VIRAGGPVTDRDLAQELPVWVDFARGMAPLLYLVAQETAKLVSLGSRSKVLDIAASHGLFGIHVARRNPGVEVVALDFPSVLTVAKENAERFGVSEHYSLLPGDALEVPFGADYDVVLISNLLHHWDSETIHVLLQKVHASLAVGGRVVIVEFVPNEDRVSPPIPAWFVMNMLANTKGGDVYTVSEFTQMLKSSGFTAPEIHALPPSAQTAIIASKK